jgi:rSAM/selenodomain-associated transferase 2
MKKLYLEVFDGQSYGHENVLVNTRRALEEANRTVGYIRSLHDLDVREDLNGYRERMRDNPVLQKTESGKYLLKKLKISVIVPIYNEEKTIEALLRQLQPLQKSCEIILVDGGSSDRTLELIPREFRVLHSTKGRANQMNRGAIESKGDVLFFLHCDSELPAKPLAEIRYVMKDHRAGCFGIAFHSRHFFMWTCRVISNHRIKDRKVMFGDQGIFITRELFFQAGMFPDLPIMEDYQFSLTLREMGIKLGIAKHRIYTSDRRFPQKTIPKLCVMWKMNRLRKMYRDGVPIEQIAEMYKDVR